MIGNKSAMNVSTSPYNMSRAVARGFIILYFCIKQEIQARSLETCNCKKIMFYNVAIFFLNFAQTLQENS